MSTPNGPSHGRTNSGNKQLFLMGRERGGGGKEPRTDLGDVYVI